MKKYPLVTAMALVAAAILGWCWALPVTAADNQGAFTETKARAEGYIASVETSAFVTLDGTDTVTGLEDPHGKFGNLRLFRCRNDNSGSMGTKPNLRIQTKFSSAAATADLKVAYYYADPAVPFTYHLLALRELATITATAAQDGSLYLGPVTVKDTYGATHAVVFSDTVSAGTVAIWLGSY